MNTILNMCYGSHDTPGKVLHVNGWYCIEGSQNVNFTYDELIEGESVETLQDVDCFTITDGVHSIEQLSELVADHEEYLREAHG